MSSFRQILKYQPLVDNSHPRRAEVILFRNHP
jgi:hypothetical protein